MKAARFLSLLALMLAFASTFAATSAHAQQREVPYWASLRFDEVNMRVGPSEAYKIDWVYRRQGMPLKVIRLREGWRLVQDHEGVQGWIAESQLRLTRGVLIIGEGLVDLREGPNATSTLRWRAEPGVVGQLIDCREGYCDINIEGRTGWVPQERLWGAEELEPSAP